MKIGASAAFFGMGIGMLGLLAMPAGAGELNKEIKFHFNQPVEMPGHVLLPGNYVFQLADTADRDVVEIYRVDKNKNEQIVTTEFAIPAYRAKATGKPVMTFEERKSNSPEAIHSWFYPGEQSGWAFVYPESQQLKTAMNRPATQVAAVKKAAAGAVSR